MVPSLICALVINDAATAEPDIATISAMIATTSPALGLRDFIRQPPFIGVVVTPLLIKRADTTATAHRRDTSTPPAADGHPRDRPSNRPGLVDTVATKRVELHLTRGV